jgi:hypothetical protein
VGLPVPSDLRERHHRDLQLELHVEFEDDGGRRPLDRHPDAPRTGPQRDGEGSRPHDAYLRIHDERYREHDGRCLGGRRRRGTPRGGPRPPHDVHSGDVPIAVRSSARGLQLSGHDRRDASVRGDLLTWPKARHANRHTTPGVPPIPAVSICMAGHPIQVHSRPARLPYPPLCPVSRSLDRRLLPSSDSQGDAPG